MRIFKSSARVSALLLLLWLPCVPQSDLRGVSGTVTDKRGNALPGAVVQIENAATMSVRSYITDNDGQYHFAELWADVDYVLKARYGIHWSKPKALSRFSSAQHLTVTLVIPIE